MDNPQDNLQCFITKTYNLMRRMDKIRHSKMNSSINKLKKTKMKIQKRTNLNPEQNSKDDVLIREITNKIKSVRYKCLQDITKANWRLHRELINKFWCQKGKEKKGRDTIMELKHTNSSPPSYTTNSVEMSQEMVKYHTNIQKLDTETPENTRHKATSKILRDMP